MRPVVVSAKARADIEAIADFIAEDNPAQGARFIEALRGRCASLAAHPLKGRPAHEIADEVRLLVFRSYVILYRALPEHVSIDRVIHGARDRSDLSMDE